MLISLTVVLQFSLGGVSVPMEMVLFFLFDPVMIWPRGAYHNTKSCTNGKKIWPRNIWWHDLAEATARNARATPALKSHSIVDIYTRTYISMLLVKAKMNGT